MIAFKYVHHLKRFLSLLPVLLPAMLLGAAGQDDSLVTITIKAVAGLRYDLPRFHVKPGTKLKIVFINEDDMSHNLVITSPGAREKVVNAALKLGANGLKMDYIPSSASVFSAIKLLSPGESRSIVISVPRKMGVYPYVCTYPGHGFLMFGAMYVTNKNLPSIKNDLNVSPAERNDAGKLHPLNHDGHTQAMPEAAHPYKIVPPYLCRTFMPDAGPAAIAVYLSDSISYCWDAGSCRLRYAWKGKFIDNTDVWKGHKDAYAKILGEIFFRDTTLFPLHPGDGSVKPTVKFKGYRLVNRFPEFNYTIDGIEVFELIKSEGSDLIRSFRIPENNKTIWFSCSNRAGLKYTASTGIWVDEKLKLDPLQAKQFTITMINENL